MISVTPMSNEKLARLPKITKPLDNSRSPKLETTGSSVLSKEIFAPDSSDGTYVTEVSYSRMAVIPLPIKTPNPIFLTKTNVWQVALDMTQAEIRSLAEGTALLNLKDDRLYEAKFTTSQYGEGERPNYLLGGDALLYLLDKQLDKSNPNNLYTRYKVAVAKRYIPKELREGYEGKLEDLIVTDDTGVHLFGKFFLNTELLSCDVSRIRRTSFSSPGLTITDHNGDLMFSTDKLNYNCGDATDEFLEMYEEDDQEGGYDADDEYTDEDVDNELSSLDDYLSETSDDGNVDFDMDEVDDMDEFTQSKTDATVSHQYDPLSIYEVLSTSKGIKRLKDTILSFVPVIPVGFRKAFEGTADYKTVLYDKIVVKSQDIEASMVNYVKSADNFADDYAFLYKMIKLLFLGGDAAMARRLRFDAKKFRSINDDLKSKHGLIRATLEGGRFDYTARTVIVSSPTMRIDSVGIPIEIVGAIFRPFLAKKFMESLTAEGDVKVMDVDIPTYIDRNYKEYLRWVKNSAGKLNLRAFIGRQPTLHYLGTQPYRVIPVEGQAIIISPLVVVPFNADFDGDQMHVEAVLTAAAHREIQENTLLSQQPKRTPNGSIAAAPRLEMVYGLYLTYYGTSVLTSEKNSWSKEQIRLRIMSNSNEAVNAATEINELCLVALQKGLISPDDTVDGINAGHAALSYLLFNSTTGVDEESLKKAIAAVDEKTKTPRINAKGFTKTICKTYDKSEVPAKLTSVVLLGNGVANRFPPRLTLDVPKELREYIAKMVEEFNTEMFRRKDLVNLGLQSLDAYDILYSEEWNKLAKKIDKAIADMLPRDNGFALMAGTGAKGDAGVLRQLFGVKGVIKQVLDRPFNCVLSHSYAESLNGLDHFCSAYGARDGLTDKVLATSKPGYLSRKLEHAGATQSIVTDDCGTTEGIEMTILDIVNMLSDADPTLSWQFWDKQSYDKASNDNRYLRVYKSAKKYVAKKIVGRNIVIDKETYNVPDEESAKKFVDECWGKEFPKLRKNSAVGRVSYQPIVMRSPITCKCPICQKCYGYDPTVDEPVPELGKQVGFIAAQAISEPGTQMTMKNFQKGGVAGAANLTSSFDVICAYFDMQGRSKTSKILYDYVAPVASVISEKRNTDGTKVLRLKTIVDLEQAAECISRGAYDEIETKGTSLKKTIAFPEGVTFKRVVQAGESVILGQKYLDPRQLLSARGCASVLKYLALLLTDIYQDSGVCSVHIETILSGMVLGKLLENIQINVDGNTVTYPAGTMVSRSILDKVGFPANENVRVAWMPIGIKQLPKYKPDSMESAIMESMSSYLPKAALLQPVDTCTNPILRVALNQGIYKKDKR